MLKMQYMQTNIDNLPIISANSFVESNIDEYLSRFDELLPEHLSGITQDAEMLMDAVSIRGLLSELFSALSGQRGMVASFFLLLLGCVILSTVASILGGKIGESVCFGVEIICSTVIFSPFFALYRTVSSSLVELNSFFGGLIPITAMLTSLGGNLSSATAGAGGMYVTMYVVGNIGGRLLSAFAIMGLALALLSSFGNASSVMRGVRSLFFWVFGIMTVLVGAGFSLQTLVASATDGLTLRTAKYMISGLVPMVGTTISGALSTLVSGLSYAKGIIGPCAVVAIIGMLLSPLALMLIYRLLLNVAEILSDFLGSSAKRLFTAYKFSLDIIISLYAISGLIYAFEIIIITRIGASPI